MWAIPTGTRSVFKKKKKTYPVKSPSIWSRVPETGSDPPIGSGRESGRDTSKKSKGGNPTTYQLVIDDKCLFSKLLSLMLFLSIIKKLRYLFELHIAY